MSETLIHPPNEPDPPVNVRLHLYSGRVVPAECIYLGRDQRGIDVWEVVTEYERADVRRMTVATFPARTTIRFPIARHSDS